MKTLSQHLLAEFCGCNRELLNDLPFIEASMRTAAEVACATVMNASFHKFGPQGVSGVLVLAESHLSVHTWPEHGYAATDIFTCGDQCFPERALDSLAQALCAASFEVMHIERGGLHGTAGMRVLRHAPRASPLSAKIGDQMTKPGQGLDRA